MRWFTSDLHLGHFNIIQYCDRPFFSVWEMNMGIVDRINSCVEPDDELWIVGDVVMGKFAETLPFVSMLNGQKFLVPGNHDRCWRGHNGPKDRPQKYDVQYEEVGLTLAPAISIDYIGSESVTVCHFPYIEDDRHGERYSEHRPVDKGMWLIHGHTHAAWRQRGRMIDVGIDAWGGLPVSEFELDRLIQDGPQDLTKITWR